MTGLAISQPPVSTLLTAWKSTPTPKLEEILRAWGWGGFPPCVYSKARAPGVAVNVVNCTTVRLTGKAMLELPVRTIVSRYLPVERPAGVTVTPSLKYGFV